MATNGSQRARGGNARFARAIPQKVELTETYAVEQVLSKNPSTRLAGDGAGLIEIRVPYDGQWYFTRQAVADVEHALGPDGGRRGDEVVIGHLLLTEYPSSLNPVVRQHDRVGVIQLRVPVTGVDGTPDLTGDRHTCVITHEYQPRPPSVFPIEVSVELNDLDSLATDMATVQALVNDWSEVPSAVIEEIRQHGTSNSMLLVKVTVRITIPIKQGQPLPNPVVTDMAVQWPTPTSLRSTALVVGDSSAPLQYNPALSRLEWKNVPMHAVPLGPNRKPTEITHRVFRSSECWLGIGHPGELLGAEDIAVTARVDVPGYLLSGTEARLYDAAGARSKTQPRVTTVLIDEAILKPEDIFARRSFGPHHQFVFDDIIPDKMRITDITTVLNNARFKVENITAPALQQDPQSPTWVLEAVRSEGPDTLQLLVIVEGKHITLDRRQVMGGNVMISGSSDSGRLKVSVLGQLPRKHKELTQELNALQQQVRDRFRPHQLSRM